jgi:hypothetical protein
MILFYNLTWNWKTSESWDIEVAEPVTKCVADNKYSKEVLLFQEEC